MSNKQVRKAGDRLTKIKQLKGKKFSLVSLVSLISLIFPDAVLSTQNSRFSCPADVETLITLLLRDLPSYANRVTQSARRRSRSVDVYSYVIVAGRPEFEPLTLGPGEYTQAAPDSNSEDLRQVFITTLERQYVGNKPVVLQQYHWLFLTRTNSGWRLAMMFSQIGLYPAGRPPTAPRESSQGVIGQAIKIWLRDCRAAVIKPL